MKINQEFKKFAQLEAIYTLFDTIPARYRLKSKHARSEDDAASIDGLNLEDDRLVCKKGCAACCTCNVTVTRLEARYMIHDLSEDQKDWLLRKIKDGFLEKRFIPKMTFNRFARFCAEGRAIPDEENDPAWGRCSLLENDLCTRYQNRPFGCRALLSTIDCRQSGFAQLPPFLLTVTNLFLQYIEQLDRDGFSGNLSDMLVLFLNEDEDKDDAKQICRLNEDRFVCNEAIKMLMVPPEHRNRIRPVIEQLNRILGMQ